MILTPFPPNMLKVVQDARSRGELSAGQHEFEVQVSEPVVRLAGDWRVGGLKPTAVGLS